MKCTMCADVMRMTDTHSNTLCTLFAHLCLLQIPHKHTDTHTLMCTRYRVTHMSLWKVFARLNHGTDAK